MSLSEPLETGSVSDPLDVYGHDCFCINLQPPKELRSLDVTFYPLRNKIKYEDLYFEYMRYMKP